jgi:Ca2+-binding EF-hand superfamily protein
MDQDRSKRLSWDEFRMIMEMMGGSKGDKSVHDYWNEFASDPERGMSFEEFKRGFRSANPEAKDEEIWELFSKADSDGSKHL